MSYIGFLTRDFRRSFGRQDLGLAGLAGRPDAPHRAIGLPLNIAVKLTGKGGAAIMTDSAKSLSRLIGDASRPAPIAKVRITVDVFLFIF